MDIENHLFEWYFYIMMTISTSHHSKYILHIDMDAFFASVEIRNNPKLKDKAVIVGGSPHSRGVVCAANYIARRYGVHSGQSTKMAYKKCPKGIFIPPSFEKYKKASSDIFAILMSKTARIESFSLDEAWMDISELVSSEEEALRFAEKLKHDIYTKTHLTCSIGIASTKFLAKIATEENKPNGIFILKREHTHLFLMNLSLERFSGVGNVFKSKLNQKGFFKGKDVYPLDRYELTQLFGKMGVFLYNRVRGIGSDTIHTHRDVKSIGAEHTFSENISDLSLLEKEYQLLFERVWKRKKEAQSTTLQFKIKLDTFETYTRRCSFPTHYTQYEECSRFSSLTFLNLIKKEFTTKQIRLIGISFINISKKERYTQLSLF